MYHYKTRLMSWAVSLIVITGCTNSQSSSPILTKFHLTKPIVVEWNAVPFEPPQGWPDSNSPELFAYKFAPFEKKAVQTILSQNSVGLPQLEEQPHFSNYFGRVERDDQNNSRKIHEKLVAFVPKEILRGQEIVMDDRDYFYSEKREEEQLDSVFTLLEDPVPYFEDKEEQINPVIPSEYSILEDEEQIRISSIEPFDIPLLDNQEVQKIIPEPPFVKPQVPKKEEKYDIRIIQNKKVKQSLKYYLTKGRKSIIKGVQRSGRYLALMKQTFKEEGIPTDLAYLSAVESTFRPNVRSRAGAVGLWQFMPSTGRRFGLKRTNWTDERMDAIKSTRAAALFLKHLKGRLDSWELSLAAYNAGEGRVRRAIRYAKSKNLPTDYWSLYLPRETRRYVASFMAATIIYKNLEKYGFDHVVTEEPLNQEKFVLSTNYSIKEVAIRSQTSFKDLLARNPMYIRAVPPLDKSHYALYLTEHQTKLVRQSLAEDPEPKIKWKNRVVLKDKSKYMTRILTKLGSPYYFRVRSGDNLWDLARKHHTTVTRLRLWNKLGKNNLLRIRQKLKVYLPTWKVFEEIIKRPKIVKRKKRKKGVILVRKGKTLSSIALRYRVTVKQLMEWNNLKKATDLRASQELIVSKPIKS